MTTYLLKITFLAIACSCVALTHAATHRENFESDELLSRAVAEISTLNHDQLEAVIDYIANCEPLFSNPEQSFQCVRVGKVLDIKTFQATDLTLIRTAIYIVDELIAANLTNTGENVKRIDRRIHIFRTLESAAAKRYKVLSTEDSQR